MILQTKLKLSKLKLSTMFCLLVVLLIGNMVYANNSADNFFWSDTAPTLSCRDGGINEGGVVIDGKKVKVELPTCEKAKKDRVLVLVNGQYLNTIFGSGADPFIENGRTMIPLRALADAFGFEVKWDQNEEKITLTKENMNIIMYIGKSEMSVDGKTVNFEKAVPMIKNSVTFLPVSQLAEILGAKVEWDSATRTATFSDKE
ncbi:hypothetical protein GCM10008933_18040 [Paenibacillus motobuensis]|uniref:Copper amine oxidase-like N-terminal domain-containing protein n=2 Tax=Paenibacillus motobuensis TaxID=295324 RepID=A0ABN0Y8X0_9BACL